MPKAIRQSEHGLPGGAARGHPACASADAVPSVPAQRVLETAATVTRTTETPAKPRVADKGTDPDKGERASTGSAVRAAKAERTAVKELNSILPWKASPEGTDDIAAEVILAEAKNGYDLLFLGLGAGTQSGAAKLPPGFEKIIRGFTGPVAVLLNPTHRNTASAPSLGKILVSMTGTDYSRFGAEVAVAIAKGCGATITALHISAPPTENDLLRHPKKLHRPGRALLAEIVALGQREGVRVLTKSLIRSAKEAAILHQTNLGGHQLIVMGTKARSGEEMHFGKRAETLIANARSPVLLLKS